MDLEDDTEAYTAILQDVLRPAAPDAAALDAWVTTLVELSLKQRAELIFGEVNGVQPPDVVKRNGMAYLEGWDTFAEIGSLFTRCARRTRDPAPRERRAAAQRQPETATPADTFEIHEIAAHERQEREARPDHPMQRDVERRQPNGDAVARRHQPRSPTQRCAGPAQEANHAGRQPPNPCGKAAQHRHNLRTAKSCAQEDAGIRWRRRRDHGKQGAGSRCMTGLHPESPIQP